MSGYRIDMAIVLPHDSSRYILGIECDGAMYHSTTNAKERDVYRQRFLESRGWTIERIWSRNWWRNSSAEIERIDQKVKELLKRDVVREKVVK
jgi:very-short-patch-repair endonuclease